MSRGASESVINALDAGWTAVCDGLAAVVWFSFDAKPGQTYRNLDVRAGDRRVNVSISPTGRSVRVFVDGKEVKP